MAAEPRSRRAFPARAVGRRHPAAHGRLRARSPTSSSSASTKQAASTPTRWCSWWERFARAGCSIPRAIDVDGRARAGPRLLGEPTRASSRPSRRLSRSSGRAPTAHPAPVPSWVPLLFLPAGGGARRADRDRRSRRVHATSCGGTDSRSARSRRRWNPWSLIVLTLLLTVAHELGHALVQVHDDRRIGEAGFMLYFGSPTFYVDASDGMMMDRGKRILQSAAGPARRTGGGGDRVARRSSSSRHGVPSAILYRFALLNLFIIFLNLIPCWSSTATGSSPI